MADTDTRRRSPEELFIPASLDDLGLSVNEFRIVCHLGRWCLPRLNPLRTSISAIHRTCRMSRETVRKTIDDLVEKGLVGKLQDDSCSLALVLFPKLLSGGKNMPEEAKTPLAGGKNMPGGWQKYATQSGKNMPAGGKNMPPLYIDGPIGSPIGSPVGDSDDLARLDQMQEELDGAEGPVQVPVRMAWNWFDACRKASELSSDTLTPLVFSDFEVAFRYFHGRRHPVSGCWRDFRGQELSFPRDEFLRQVGYECGRRLKSEKNGAGPRRLNAWRDSVEHDPFDASLRRGIRPAAPAGFASLKISRPVDAVSGPLGIPSDQKTKEALIAPGENLEKHDG